MGSMASTQSRVAYSRMQALYNADAIAYGAVTTRGFVGSREPELPRTASVPAGDYVAKRNAYSYYVSIDPAGEIAWSSGTFSRSGRPDAHVVEVLASWTPDVYKAYLRKRGVSYVIAGEGDFDLSVAAEKLGDLFGIRRMLVCGGGVTDGAFLSAGLIDELSVVFAPVASGQSGVATMFDESRFAAAGALRAFTLDKVERLDGDGLHLVYVAR